MLARLHRIALALAPLSLPAWLLLVGSAGLFAYAVLGTDGRSQLAPPAMITGIWAVLLLSFLYGFRAVPEPIAKPWYRRWMRGLHRGGYWLLALITAVASVGLVMLCLRLLLYANTN